MALIGNKIRYLKKYATPAADACWSVPKAIREKEKVIGRVEQGLSEGVQVVTGILNIGEASGVPIIDYISNIQWDPMELTFIDCPPGSECIVMESIKDADYCILVAEPTLFGVHNLNMVCELVNLFNKPMEW